MEFSEQTMEILKQTYRAIVEKTKVPGLSYSLIIGDKFKSDSIGYSDLKKKMKADSEKTIYAIGSVSKSMCGFAMMKLAEEKKVNLEDPIDKYISSIKWTRKFGKPIRIIDLLSQSSGIPDMGLATLCLLFEIDDDPRRKNYDISNEEKYIDHINSAYDYITEPGKFRYCNSNFTIAQLIIEKVSGVPYAEYIQKVLFDRFEMKSSSFSYSERCNAENHAGFYQLKKIKKKGAGDNIPPEIAVEEKEFEFPYFYVLGPGGAYSTVNDLSRYTISLLNNDESKGIMLDESIDNLFQHHTSPLDILVEEGFSEFDGGYGLGWIIMKDFFGKTLIMHPGDLEVSCSLIAFIKEDKIGICVSANSNINSAIIPTTVGILASFLGQDETKFRNVSEVGRMCLLCGEYDTMIIDKPLNIFMKGCDLYVSWGSIGPEIEEEEKKKEEVIHVLHPMKASGDCFEYFQKSSPAGYTLYKFSVENNGETVRLETGKYVFLKKKKVQ